PDAHRLPPRPPRLPVRRPGGGGRPRRRGRAARHPARAAVRRRRRHRVRRDDPRSRRTHRRVHLRATARGPRVTGGAAPRVLVAGHVTLDAYPGGLAPGGSAYYAGRTYLALGAAVRVATAAGPDFPRAALDGAEVDLAPSPVTTTFENAHGPAGREQRVSSIAPALDPARLAAAWLACDLLHLAPVVAEIALGPWLAASRARFVGLGVQ